MSRSGAISLRMVLVGAVVSSSFILPTGDSASAATLQFAGRSWTIKQANSPVGPGPNRFSGSPNDVWSDDSGLHLTIHKTGAYWYSTEVILNESNGYGTYVFQTNSRQDILNANATFGAFTWDSAGGDTIPNNPNREIDFEDGRWGNAANSTSSQVVVQPYYLNGNLQRITLPNLSEDAALTRFFTWSPGKVEFYSLRGHHSPTDFPAESVIHHYTYVANGTTRRVPTPGAENFRFNLWLFQSTAPVGEAPVEVVVNDFAFLPLKAGDFNNDGTVDALDLGRWRGDFGVNRDSDANADADSNGNDYLVWQRKLHNTLDTTTMPIPEPSAAHLATGAVVFGIICGHHARSRRPKGLRAFTRHTFVDFVAVEGVPAGGVCHQVVGRHQSDNDRCDTGRQSQELMPLMVHALRIGNSSMTSI